MLGSLAASARIKARYPLATITPCDLSVKQRGAISFAPEERARFVESLLRREYTNKLSARLREADVFRSCMLPNISEGDTVLFSERLYLGGYFDPPYPERLDVIAFWHPQKGDGMIKRLIGLPGDEVEIRAGKILHNGKQLDESYGVLGNPIDMDKILVPRRHVFILADNRQMNDDSRSFGPLHISFVFGIVREILK